MLHHQSLACSNSGLSEWHKQESSFIDSLLHESAHGVWHHCKIIAYATNTYSIAPPSAVQNVRVTEPVGNTTVEVHWDRPLSNGGRMDGFYYNVEYRDVGNLGAWIRANEDRIRSNTYLVRGLKPVSRYMIRIIAENNVSDQEPETMGDRTIERVVTTDVGSKFQALLHSYMHTLFELQNVN